MQERISWFGCSLLCIPCLTVVATLSLHYGLTEGKPRVSVLYHHPSPLITRFVIPSQQTCIRLIALGVCRCGHPSHEEVIDRMQLIRKNEASPPSHLSTDHPLLYSCPY
ncbi:hypothetical protein F4859DRAFT_232357 [Xylaria cf. heliscus]|nr:hypothetical protein F4859DRAFT_232357 [Xylaria cf. heliscus]